jgi:hypothetical protein
MTSAPHKIDGFQGDPFLQFNYRKITLVTEAGRYRPRKRQQWCLRRLPEGLGHKQDPNSVLRTCLFSAGRWRDAALWTRRVTHRALSATWSYLRVRSTETTRFSCGRDVSSPLTNPRFIVKSQKKNHFQIRAYPQSQPPWRPNRSVPHVWPGGYVSRSANRQPFPVVV